MTIESLERAKAIIVRLEELSTGWSHLDAATQDCIDEGSFNFCIRHKFDQDRQLKFNYMESQIMTEKLSKQSQQDLAELYLEFCRATREIVKKEMNVLEKEFEEL